MLRVGTLLLYELALVCLAIEDLKHQKIRNIYIFGILLLVLPGCFAMPEIGMSSRLIGMFAISAPLAGLSILRKRGIGGGDIKLVFASGAFLGVELLLQGTAIAILLAGCYGIYLLLYKKEEILKKFPLGPFLSTGYILVLTLTEKSKTVIIH